jgi:hypothetical protein
MGGTWTDQSPRLSKYNYPSICSGFEAGQIFTSTYSRIGQSEYTSRHTTSRTEWIDSFLSHRSIALLWNRSQATLIAQKHGLEDVWRWTSLSHVFHLYRKGHRQVKIEWDDSWQSFSRAPVIISCPRSRTTKMYHWARGPPANLPCTSWGMKQYS